MSLVHGRRGSTPPGTRRPLQRINANAAILSPTKRRKQSHTEECLQVAVADLVKTAAFCEATCLRREQRGRAVFTRWSSDEQNAWPLLFEVFSRLAVRDLIGEAAPACKFWRELAHSKELWAIMRTEVRLLDQLLLTDKVVERRSKGRLFKCKRLGSGEVVLLRMVDLALTNAGKDDGLPTSFLRESALLKKLQHPNIIRHFGSEIVCKRALICTEFVHENFAQWYKRLQPKPTSDKVLDIKVKFRQLLDGLAHVHHQGVMHRNLKPDNLFLDPQGCVKIGDFTTTRMLDLPFQAYTPEDPKERDRSGREMRRLWYRAPELILREEIYGPKVDTWSVGCLLAEAASGEALFQSDSEIDHLFRVFRLTGTPSMESWPEVVETKTWTPNFPVYSGIDFALVARATVFSDKNELVTLRSQAFPDRDEIIQNLIKTASVLGAEGMLVLDQLVALPPSSRVGADAALSSPFFSCRTVGVGATTEQRAEVEQWLQGKGAPPKTSPEVQDGRERVVNPSPLVVRSGRPEKDCPPPVSIPSSLVPSHMVWNILRTMQRTDCCTDSPPKLPRGFTADQRSTMMDFVVGLASTLELKNYTLHLAATIIDSYLARCEEPVASERHQLIGATCLKVADVFTEQSKEYYKQESAKEYAESTQNHVSAEDMLALEKEMLPKLKFNLHMPTTHWFTQCYLAYARFNSTGKVAQTTAFIGDLTLLDHGLQRYSAALRAQCAMVLAVFLAQQAESASPSRSRSSPPASSATYLSHWDEHVRDKVCIANRDIDAEMCMQAVARIVSASRREWKRLKLLAVEVKHATLVRTLVYPDRFPVSMLVKHILPNGQHRIGVLRRC